MTLTLPDMLGSLAMRYGDKPALRYEGRTSSFVDLHQRARHMAAALKASGIGPDDRVAFLGRNSDLYYEFLFGVAVAGAVTTPVNWRLADEEIDWILRDAEVAMLFVDREFADARTEPFPVPLHVVNEDMAAWRDSFSMPASPGESACSPNDVAIQLYTSGTTGRPKGVLLTHRSLLIYRSLPASRQPEWNCWTDDDVSLIVNPVFHISGTGFGLQTLCAGATGLIVREFDAEQILSFIAHDALSKIFVVPSALQMLLRHPRAGTIDYSRLRTVLYGGSPMPHGLLEEALALFGCDFVQMYGMTESCGTISALNSCDLDPAFPARLRSAGRALDGVEIAIADAAGQLLPTGSMGEIVTRSPLNMAGYWRQPDATAAAIGPDGWLRTGDIGNIDADGYLYIRDRLKDMIVTGGENVYPAEVEAVIQRHPDVLDVAIIGVPSEKWGEEVKAMVVPVPGTAPDARNILSAARLHIAGYKLPKSIDFVEALPRNASGKILRRALRDKFWSQRDDPIS